MPYNNFKEAKNAIIESQSTDFMVLYTQAESVINTELPISHAEREYLKELINLKVEGKQVDERK